MARLGVALLLTTLFAPLAIAETQTYTLTGCSSAFQLFCHFDIPAGAAEATISLDDAVFGDAPCFSVQWGFENGTARSGTVRGYGRETYAIPSGAVDLNVFLGHIRIPNCAIVQGQTAPPTTGTVTVEWG